MSVAIHPADPDAFVRRLTAAGRPNELALAFVLWCWRNWIGEAIADGTALKHFEQVSTGLVRANFRRQRFGKSLLIDVPPSIKAIAAEWPQQKPVPLLVYPAPGMLDAKRVAEIQAVLATARLAVGEEVSGLIIFCESLAPDCPRRVRAVGNKPYAGAHAISEVEAMLPRARVLIAPLQHMADAKERASKATGVVQPKPAPKHASVLAPKHPPGTVRAWRASP